MKSRKEESPICITENIPLFVLYLKNKLSREQQVKVDRHIQQCTDCRMNFAYIEEILTCKQRLSIDEKTLLLKYINDPLWYQSINEAKKHLREEILGEVKELLKQSNIDCVKVNVDSKANCTASNNTGDNLKDDSTNNKSSSNSFTTNQPINNTTGQKYSYVVLSLLITTFIILSSSIVLITTKHTNLGSFLSSKPTTSIPSITNSQQSSSVENNLYLQLDIAIDEFLSSQNKDSLNKAAIIAKDIEDKYQDKYGADLVTYYKTVPSLSLEKLLGCRKELDKLFNQATADDYKQRLELCQNLEKSFLSLGNLIEAYKTKTLINKLNVQLHNHEVSQLLTQEGLKFSVDNKYIFLQVNFLLWQAKRFSEISDSVSAEESFLKVIELASQLNLYKLVNSAGMSLAMLYYKVDDNEKAFELTKKLLLNFTDYKNTQAISILQIAGISSFNLHYYEIANSYLKEAIKNSQDINNASMAARSYAFLALTLAEERKFVEADKIYILAESELTNIKDEVVKQEVLSIVVGYKAKAMLLKQDYSQALEFYRHKLNIINSLNLGSNLEISQVNEAMAITLEALGDKEKAQEHNAIAKHYQNLAEANKETTNCLLSLVPTNCGFQKP